MRCTNCNKQNARSSSFCVSCGEPLGDRPRATKREGHRVAPERHDEPDHERATGSGNGTAGRLTSGTEDLAHGQPVIIAARWVLVVTGLILALIHPDPDAIVDLRVMIVVILGLAGANFYLHTQMLMKRPALALVVYGASAADLVAITAIVLAQGGFESQTFVFYFPAILAFSVAFGTELTLAFAGAAIATYGLVALSTYSGDNPEVIIVRLLMLAGVAFCGTMYWRIERQRREADVPERRGAG